MDERIRRVAIFGGIVGVGSLLIFLDLPLLFILPLVLATGVVLLIIVGALPLAEINTLVTSRLLRRRTHPAPAASKAAAPVADPAGQAASGGHLPFGLDRLLKRARGTKASSPPVATQPKPAAQDAKRASAPVKSGLSVHIDSLLGSFRALGGILAAPKKSDPDKLKKIDSMLDFAVSEKPDGASAVPVPETLKEPRASGTGAMQGGPVAARAADENPFLSLSDDEIDSGLLDDLDEEPEPAPEGTGPAEESPGISIPAMDGGAGRIPNGNTDMSLPPLEVTSSAEEILRENEPELAELPALEGVESVEENLGELDNLNLDSVDLEHETGEADQTPTPAPSGAAAGGKDSAGGTAAPAAGEAPAPDWVDTKVAGATGGAVDAPAGASGTSSQSEMAAFAAASGADDDMLSSLASDIKTQKKDVDVSLVRDLKDFRAPGSTIESELTEIYGALNTAAESQKKRGIPPRKSPAPK